MEAFVANAWRLTEKRYSSAEITDGTGYFRG